MSHVDAPSPCSHAPVVRRADPAEHAVLEALQRRARLANPSDRQALLDHPDAVSLPPGQLAAGHVFVAQWRGVPAGFAALAPRADGDVDLDGLFVEPSLWRHGLGRALVERMAQEARALGARTLHVVGNPHSRAFYERCGFEHAGGCETRFGRALSMARALARSAA